MTEIGATALKLSMLYVEDEQETREFLSDSLAINYPDIQLFVASNGADGLDMYRKYRPDIVITDIRMPIIDGIGMSSEIKLLRPQTIIIALTAVGDAHYLIKAIEAGINSYVLKPLNQEKLFTVIDSTVSHLVSEQRIKEQNEYIRKLSIAVEQNPCPVVVTDSEGVIEYVNPIFTELTGYSLDEVRGASPRILQTSQTPRAVYTTLWKTITAGNTWRGEFHNRKKNGETYWESASISPMFNECGDITHYVAVKQDITEQKRNEALLAEREQIFRSLFEFSRDAVLCTAPDGIISMANTAACKMFGWTDEEFCRLGRNGIMDLEDDRLVPALEKRKQTGFINTELTCIRKNGEKFPAEISSVIVAGHIQRSFVIIHDISARKQAELALKLAHEQLEEKVIGQDIQLRYQEEKLSTAFRLSPDAVIVTRVKDGKYIQVNDGFTRVTGYTGDEALGKTALELNLWASPDERHELLRLLKSHDHVENFRASFRRKDSTLLNGLLYARIIEVAEEPCIMSFTRDITELVRAEEEVQRQSSLLQAAFDNAPFELWVRDTNGCCIMENRALRNQWGSIIGATPGEMALPPETLAIIIESNQRAFNGDVVTFEAEYVIAGCRQIYEHITAPIRINNEITCILGINQNITTLSEIRENQEDLATELSLQDEQIRLRISSELHDHIGQSLALCKIKLSAVNSSLLSVYDQSNIADTYRLLEKVIGEVRSLTLQLTPPLLITVGLEATLEWLCRQMKTDYGLNVFFLNDGSVKPLSDVLRSVVYQATRELLINVAKHAMASEAFVSVSRNGDSLLLTVKDDGIGFDPDLLHHTTKKGCFGIFNLVRQFRYLNGFFRMEQPPDGGSVITISVPLTTAEETGERQ